jgi:outer membrane lipoprotein-sorting protein
MSLDPNPDNELDDLLRVGYAELRQTRPEQRQAIVDALTDAQLAPQPPARLVRVRWQRWALVAVCLVALLATWSWRTTSRDGFAYGIEDVPQRLAEVQSFRLRGWQWIPWDNGKKKQPPIRVPMEITVERPGKFRHANVGMTFHQGQKPIIQPHMILCDGKHQWSLDGNNKLESARPVSRLDALLRTERIAQIAARFAVLGPPDAHYRRIRREEQNGHACDLYEARFPTGGVARVWIDPKDGLPVRVVRGQLEADGTLSPSIELTVAINVPLSDELFRFNGPEDPKLAGAPALRERTESPVLDLPPTASGDGDDMHCEVWYTFRISDNAALIIWRRSAPVAKTNEAPDWLSGITIFASDPFTSKPFGSVPRGVRELRHHWVHQSNAADKWNWSLVVPADGKSLGHAEVFLRMEAPQSLTTLDVTPLSFRENDLRDLLSAAQRLMLPSNSADVSLPYLQAIGRKLASDDSPR